MADQDHLPQFDPDKYRLNRGRDDPRITREPAYSAKESFPLEQYEDEDGNIVTEQPEPPRFKSPRELADARALMREEAAEEAEAQREQDRQQERANQQARVNDPYNKAAFETAFVKEMTEASNKLLEDEAAFRSSVRDRVAEFQTLQQNPATMRRAAEVRDELKRQHDELTARREHLTGLSHQAQHYQQTRMMASARNDLHASVPELADPVQAEEFKSWLRAQGATEGMINSPQNDAGTIVRAAKMWRAERDAKRKAVEQKKIKATAFAYRGSGSEGSSKEARENLRNTGSTASALRYLQTKRLEKKAGI